MTHHNLQQNDKRSGCDKAITSASKIEALHFWIIHRHRLNLRNPQTFSEKIVWRKLFDRNPIFIRLSDKLAVREFICERLGNEAQDYLVPLLWSGDKVDDIPWDRLPEQFVLKVNHGSRMNHIQLKGQPLDTLTLSKKAQKWLQRDFGKRRNEWAYQQIERKLLVEQYISDEGGAPPIDVKLFMFNGQLGQILMIQDGKRLSFNENLEPLQLTKGRPINKGLKLPPQIGKMIEIAKTLSSGFDHLRIDLFSVGSRIYCGEITVYSGSGRIRFSPQSENMSLGKKWTLDKTHALTCGSINFTPPKLEKGENPKIAYAVQKYHHPGQTFVNRHIENLFGGNACVISERPYGPEPSGAPSVFYIGRNLANVGDIIRMPFMAWKNYRDHHGFRVPYGAHKEKLIAFLEKERASIILSEFGSQAMLVSELGKELGIPVFCYFRGRDASFWLHNQTRVKAYKKLFPNLAGIFAVSQFLIDNLAAAGISHPNSHVVPSGTDIDLFRPHDQKQPTAVVVGRFVKKKAPLINIQAFHAISDEFPDAKLELIGDGPSMKECEDYVKSHNLLGRVIFHGKQNSQFIASRLSTASIFMQHSVIDPTGEAEGLPSSIQEAMASGCAICSTIHAGIPEIVQHGENGYLCDEYDLKHYTQNLRKLFANPEATLKMGQLSRKIAEEKIDYKKLYAHVESVMRKSLENPNKF